MHRICAAALGLIAFAACERDLPPPPPSPPKAVAPVRGAAGDADLRVMLSEIVAAKACDLIRGGFHGLRAPDHPDVVTGVLWIRDCEISSSGTNLTFHVGGNGWLWVDQTKTTGGGTFAVHQYVRFGVETTMRGALDITYDRASHVATLYFTPERAPEVAFSTIGAVDVDRQGVWSSVVGALGTMFASSPEETAGGEATSRGTQQLAAQLANGLAVTTNLCTGLSRVHLGRPPKGQMGAADVGETRHVPVEVQPGGVIIVGPQDAGDGMTLEANALQGAVRLTLVCAKHAETVAEEFMAGRITTTVPVVGAVLVRTKAKLGIKATTCPVVVVVSPLGEAPARFDWVRPTSEIARATGGPMIRCEAKPRTRS